MGSRVLYCNRFIILHNTLYTMHKNKHKNKHFRSYSTLKSTVVQYTDDIPGLALSEQARRVTDWRERRWELIALKDCQQQETGGQTVISLTPDINGISSDSLLDSSLSTFLEEKKKIQ